MARPRILVTRSPHQASALAEHLRALGAEPVLVPVLELVDPNSFEPLDDALARLERFDWLLFTSANAVEAFSKRAEGRSAAMPKIAAIGAATARALESIELRVDLIPAKAVAESFADALLPYARQSDDTPTRFLLVRAEVARDCLPQRLQEAGAEVTIVPAYRTVIPAASVAAIRKLFASRESWPDAVTFTSSSAATNLFAVLEAAGSELSQDVLRISIGPVTSKTLCDFGFPPHMEAKMPTVTELADAVMLAVSLRDEGK